MAKKEFLGERDYKLFDLLYQFKVATVDDIRALVFDGIGRHNVYSRLKQLVQLELIQKIPYQRERRFLAAYSLTERCFKKLVYSEGERVSVRKQFKSGKIGHDLSILTIYRRIIQSSEVSNFLTENVLMSNSAVIRSLDLEEWIRNSPDGILIHESNKGRHFLPLECELSIKAGFRYETKLINYYQSEKVPALIYVCGNAKVKEAICRVEKKYCHQYPPKVFYGLLEDGQRQLGEWTFSNRKGVRLTF